MNNKPIQAPQPTRGRTFVGKIVSAKTPKTVIVGIEHTTRHRLYKKAVKRTRHFAAHNESLVLAEGDQVKIGETKPISKTKRFMVLSKVT
jgi:small subunit ribosomal protein S17